MYDVSSTPVSLMLHSHASASNRAGSRASPAVHTLCMSDSTASCSRSGHVFQFA
jgi:hypothetical protein